MQLDTIHCYYFMQRYPFITQMNTANDCTVINYALAIKNVLPSMRNKLCKWK